MVFYGDTDVYFDTSNYRLSIVVSAARLTACPSACHAEGTELKRFHDNFASASCFCPQCGRQVWPVCADSINSTLRSISLCWACSVFPAHSRVQMAPNPPPAPLCTSDLRVSLYPCPLWPRLGCTNPVGPLVGVHPSQAGGVASELGLDDGTFCPSLNLAGNWWPSPCSGALSSRCVRVRSSGQNDCSQVSSNNLLFPHRTPCPALAPNTPAPTLSP